ncbi:hypothetical protein BGX31_003616 [Mortierella sp. GBA43]|nr:hypothetical protein BGX31_003616 [Mortierella sp. GBA43]
MHPHPLGIPEVLEQVVKYLSRRDITGCLCVSKAFYTIALASLWSSIELSSYHQKDIPLRYPLGLPLHKHKHHIQTLTFNNDYPLPYLTLQGCSRLQSVKINTARLDYDFSQAVADDYQDRVLYGFAGLVQAHASTLREVKIQLSPRHMSVPPKDIWSALLACQHLSSLDLSYIRISDDAVPLFLRVLIKPRILTLTCVKLDDLPADMTDFVFTGPRRLSIVKHSYGCQMRGMPSRIQATLVRQCRNVESLQWRGYCPTFGSESNPEATVFFNALSMDPWPLSNLHTLELMLIPMKDEDLATVLKQMHRLRHLNAHGTRFGNLSFQAIIMDRSNFSQSGRESSSSPYGNRLCDSIELLKITQCQGVTGNMIQVILANCPRLTHFYADKLTMTEIVSGKEWICVGLKELDIYLDADVRDNFYHRDVTLVPDAVTELQRESYGRLAVLTGLERLHLTNDYTSSTERRTLDLTLNAGLDLLAGLTNLKEITFRSDSHQQIGLEEAVWIKRHWPKLEVFRGYLNSDEGISSQLKTLLGPVVIEDACKRFKRRFAPREHRHSDLVNWMTTT